MDFSELFTQGARDILPLARKKNLTCCFDYSGSFIDIEQGHDQLRSATHRILLGMVDCLDSGFILLRATAEPAQNGSSLVVIHAAGTGVGAPAGIDDVLFRLQLDSRAGTNGERGDGITRAAGTCPATGGAVSFVNAGAEGAAMSVTIQVPAVDRPGNSRAPDAGRAAAWVVAPLAGGLELTDRRLRRLGWNVASFPSLRHAAALPVGGVAALPTLLIVAESTGSELAQLEEATAATPALWPWTSASCRSARWNWNGSRPTWTGAARQRNHASFAGAPLRAGQPAGAGGGRPRDQPAGGPQPAGSLGVRGGRGDRRGGRIGDVPQPPARPGADGRRHAGDGGTGSH